MCILQPCSRPTESGVWWRDDARWCLYSPENQQRIRDGLDEGLASIDLGIIRSNVHPGGARYTANLNNMAQVAVSSGQQRDILIIDLALPAAVPQNAIAQADPGHGATFQPRIHYANADGQFVQYDTEIARAVLQAYTSGVYSGASRTFLLARDSSTFYSFDFEAMTQSVVRKVNGEVPRLVEEPVPIIIDIPWNPRVMAALVVSGEAKMRRKVLMLVVEKCSSNQHLDNILPVKASPKTIVSKAYASLVPGEAHYERFLDCLDMVCRTCDKDKLGAVLNCIQTGVSDGRGPLRIGFKSADARPNVRSRKLSDAECYQSMAALTAAATAVLSSCAAQLKMRVAVFLVLLPAPERRTRGKLSNTHSGVVDITEPEPDHTLRLAEITVN